MALTPSLRGTTGAAQDRMAGRVLGGRYRVLSRLGEGGMGTVYLCEHAVLGRRYALKVLRAELRGDAELGERFRNEAIAASRIGSENVVDVLDFGSEDDGALYYVMEALDGRSLAVILAEEGPLAVPRVLDLLDQICRALAAAHARGVIHRDIKPDNVFVVRRPDGGEQAKVIDFGISQVAPPAGKDRLTLAGSIIGTPEYMAPEQAVGDPIDERADVYALGVLAYELLTGTLPIVALTPVATLVAHQTSAPLPPSRRRPGIPPAVDALVLRALAKLPADRPRTMDAFSAAIAEIRGGGAAPSAAPAPAAARPTAGQARETVVLPEASGGFTPRLWRSRRSAAIMVGVVAAIVAGAVWWSVAPAPGEAGKGMASARPAAISTAMPGSTSSSTSTAIPIPTPTPTPTAIAAGAEATTSGASSTSTSTSTAAPAPAPVTATRAAAEPAPKKVRRVVRERRAAEPDGAAALKDPYR